MDFVLASGEVSVFIMLSMDIYRETILDHYKNPRNFGRLVSPTAHTEEINISCGDRIIVDVLVESGHVTDIRFIGEGCAIHQASASMLTEKVKGMDVSQVLALAREDVEALLGTSLTPSRIKCALLPLEAIQKAVQSVV